MFIDNIEIKVKAGRGGNGAVSFRREKYEPQGGPNGGDGGDGGDVILKVDKGLNTLSHLRYNNIYKAKDGKRGQEKGKTGKEGKDLILNVPPGTIVYDSTGKELIDLTEPESEFVIARGGQGGRGNARFKSSTRQAPKFAEEGQPGEEKNIRLELKLIADVGLVGFPNVGKSTIISKISAARPKIAGYHFTTITPNLGVVEYDQYSSYVVADVPGLIEGAHQGEGLGDEFLRHLERTKILAHVLDASGLEGRDPKDDFKKISNELRSFSKKLSRLPQIVVLNKVDLFNDRQEVAELMKYFQDGGYEVYPVSAITGEGIKVLKKELGRLINEYELPEETIDSKEDDMVVITPDFEDEEPELIVNKIRDKYYEVKGKLVERLVSRTDMSNDAAVRRMLHILRKEGLYEILADKNIPSGATVRVGGLEFDYIL
ncbi:GTPase ObgE [Halanaerobiaceae bacterium Z-7014]|uniref:GTPase Obg n=1 Tax=Halonatronomonas betaini TaxID=2778430 RepID=A0A931F924_9FIRM|nr:GTPase ObgE [Halonatronomonas betaini]MBF8435974.1 GTPase ObgE [Halonatronomonas betaini]